MHSVAADLHAPPGAGGAERSVREVGDAIAAEVEQDFETQRKAAVASKMFGRLTRETEEWHPDRLLCKRFHIPDPYPKVWNGWGIPAFAGGGGRAFEFDLLTCFSPSPSRRSSG